MSFSYNESNEVLKHISFKAEPGEMTAIVGVTGAGKTTLMSLAERFYEPVSGSVLYGGRDIRGY